MLSFILWIVGCIIASVIIVNIVNKVKTRKANRVEKVKSAKTMTKDRYNAIGNKLLFIIFGVSPFVCWLLNSYIPFIVAIITLIGFIRFAKNKYGYSPVEYREIPIEMMTKEESFKKFDEDRTFSTINACSIYYSED